MDPGRKSERHTDTNTLSHTQTPFECASRGSERRRSTLATAPIHPDTEPLLFGKEKSIHLLSAIHVFSNNQSTKTGYWGAFYSAIANAIVIAPIHQKMKTCGVCTWLFWVCQHRDQKEGK